MGTIFERVTGAPAGLWELEGRGRLRVTGGDRIRFIDGMLTCAVEGLGPGAAAPGLALDRKGHILGLLWVLRLDDALLIEAETGASVDLAQTLERYVIADDVQIEDLREPWGELSVEGPGSAAAVLERTGVWPEPGRGEASEDGLLWLGGGALGEEGARVLGPRSDLEALRAQLALPEVRAEHAEVLRIHAFRPRCGVDLGERSLPAEGPFADRISFTKGCYLGQEIVSRIQSRGGVHHKLVRLSATAPVAPGARIRLDAAERGVVTSAVTHPALGTHALGRLRHESPEPGLAVEIDSVPGEIVEVPRAFDSTR
ncbi:MAG: YgfZ/GcvT domain-containing protein [Myxococcota bacterium]